MQQILGAGLDDWRVLPHSLHARFLTGDFSGGLALIAAVGGLEDCAGNEPELALTAGCVDITLRDRDSSGLTERDLAVARRISGVAREQGAPARPAVPAVLELALDTADVAAIGPFWAALLTGDAGALDGDEIVDPTGQLPLLWFQRTEQHTVPRQRFHLDVWVPHDVAAGRIDAAVAAGGRVVDDAEAPAFTVLADAEGNRACVCTTLGR